MPLESANEGGRKRQSVMSRTFFLQSDFQLSDLDDFILVVYPA